MSSSRQDTAKTVGAQSDSVSEREAATLSYVSGRFAVPFAAATVTFVLGVFTLLGWLLDMPTLRTLQPGGIPMLPNTAVAFVCAALCIALVCRDNPRWNVALPFAIIVAAFGTTIVIERLTNINVGVDLLLFPDAVRREPWLPPGRPAINSALAFTSFGTALCRLRYAPAPGERNPAEILALPGAFIVTLALIGHLYGVSRLYAFGPATGMALPTALAFASLAIAIYFARDDFTLPSHLRSKDGDGVLVRTQLPITIGLALALGYAWLGLRRAGIVDRETGVSLFVLAIIAISIALVLSFARKLRRMGNERENLLQMEQRAREAAQKANTAKGEFIRTMSHELRTPLNAIAGYTELLELGLRGPLTDTQREDLARIRQSQQMLLVLVEDVLAFAKLEAGQMHIEIADISLHDAVRSAVASVRPQYQKKGLSLVETAGVDGVIVSAEAPKLQQIITNLLTNAFKFTPRSGTVTVSIAATGIGGCVRIADTGIGIPRDMLEKVFEPFVQVDMGLTRAAGGTGLGLAISRDLARRMGGDLTVESTEGVGSTFTLLLKGARTTAG